MGCPIPACAECTQNCLLIHGKNQVPSPVVISFFKIMIGDNFSKLLFLPPKFARTVSDLTDQKTQLEDANGQRWTVTLSNYDGSLAFQQGWHAFSQEHGLEVGDFLVFHYIMQSHFVVQIYGKNGCQKLKFSEDHGNRKKRARTNRNLSATDVLCLTIGNDSMIKQGSSTSAVSGSNVEISRSQPMAIDNTSNIDSRNGRFQLPSTKYIEEPFYMIDRDSGDRHGDHWSPLYDLANFEMQRTSVVDGTNKVLVEDERSPCHVNTMLKSQAEADIVDKIPVTKEEASWLGLSEVSNFPILEKNKDFQMTDNILSMSEKDSGNGNTYGKEQRSKTHLSNNQALISMKEKTPLMGCSKIAQQKFAGVPEFCGVPVSVPTPNCQSRERLKVVKQEQVDVRRQVCGHGEMTHGKYPEIKECDQISNSVIKDSNHDYKVVKTEPVDTMELSSTVAGKISVSAVAEKQYLLELPTCLPSVSFRGRSRFSGKVLALLRDPLSRLWPVLYHEKYGFKTLTSGWEAFGKANSIRPGDECVFAVENASELIYRVGIVRK